MGGKSSKGGNGREYSSSGSSSFNQYGYSHSQTYPQYEPTAYQAHTATPIVGYSNAAQIPHQQPQLNRRYSRIPDNFNTLDQVTYSSLCLTFLMLSLPILQYSSLYSYYLKYLYLQFLNYFFSKKNLII